MTTKLTILTPLLLITGCTVGATLPFGGSAGYSTASYTSGGGGSAPSGGYTEASEASEPAQNPADRELVSARPACVHDSAGVAFGNAMPLTPGVNRGCVENAKTDVYSVTAPDDPAGTLYVFRMVADDQICTTIYNQDKQQLGGGECVTDNESGYYWAALAPGSTLYVKLERTHGRASPYLLEIKEFAIDDVEEPNSSFKQATALALGKPHTAMLHATVNDKRIGSDFYKVDVDQSGVLEIVIDPQSDDVQPEVFVFNADKKQIARDNSDNDGAVLRMREEVAPGRYYVQVVENSTSFRPYGIDLDGAKPTSHYVTPYQLTIDVEGERPAKKRISRR